jgi:hypothetical protein
MEGRAIALGQFLYREIYIGGRYRTGEYAIGSIEGGVDITLINNNGKKEQIKLDASKINTILEDVAYWTKANQIHRWFTEDSDSEIYVFVNGENLIGLKSVCERVIDFLEKQERVIKYEEQFNEKIEYEGFRDDSLAFEILPPEKDSNFGPYIIDDNYLSNLKYTVEALKDIDPNDSFIYEASY